MKVTTALALLIVINVVALEGVAASGSASASDSDALAAGDPSGTTPLGACLRNLEPGTWTDCGTSPIPLLTEKDNPPPYWGCGSTGVLYAWTGAAFDGRTMYFTGGGHRYYGGNEIYAFDAYALKWKVLTEPGRELVQVDEDGDGKTDYCEAIYTDGTPNPRHTYDGIVWADDKVYFFGGVTYCTARHGGAVAIWTFDPVGRQFERLPDVELLPLSRVAPKTAFDPASRCIFVATRRVIGCFRDGTWAYRASLSPSLWGATMDIAPDRRLLVTVGEGKDSVRTWEIQDDGQLGKSGLHRLSIPGAADRAGLAYDSERRVFALWSGGREIVVIDPDDWSVERFANTEGHGPPPPHANSRGVYSKWAYIPGYDVFMGYTDHRYGVWFYRLTDR